MPSHEDRVSCFYLCWRKALLMQNGTHCVTKTVAGIADWTGVPLSSLLKDEQAELLHLETLLTGRVVGQDIALTAIAQRLRASKTGLMPESGPQDVFLLAGPSGTGKTETAHALYGGEKAFKAWDDLLKRNKIFQQSGTDVPEAPLIAFNYNKSTIKDWD